MIPSDLIRVVQTPSGFAVELSVELATTRTIEEAKAISEEFVAIRSSKPVSTGGRALRINVYPELKEIGASYGDVVDCILLRKI